MNRFAVVVCCGVLGISTVCLGSDELTFTLLKPVGDANIMNVSGVSRAALNKALELHNLMVELRGVSSFERDVSWAVQARELREKKLQAMKNCSVNKLSETFKEPNAVWDKMTSQYAQKEKDLSIYINSSQTATEKEIQEFNAYMERGEMTDDVVSELLSQWQIGNEILTDVYANQDAWGERKNENAPSFPLWEDQKYIFDKEWNKKYEAINLYFGVPPQGRPVIGEEKYDYAKADKLEKAHAAYIALLSAKNPVKAAALPPSLKKPPVAPKPLPPKKEHLVYLESSDPKKAIYPSLPEPWKTYEKEGFKDINPVGEMAEDFSSGLNLKEEAKKSAQGNRLTQYAGLQQDLDGAKQYEKIVLNNAEKRIAVVLQKISQYISLEPNVDLLDFKEREKVLKQLQEKYKVLLTEAETEMNSRQDENIEIPTMDLKQIEDLAMLEEINPDAFNALETNMPNSIAERDKLLLVALKKDSDGRVFLNEVNAGDVEKMIKEAKSIEALTKEQEKMNIYTAEPIDETCLNGGL